MKRIISRSAKTGEFITYEEAEANPSKTVSESYARMKSPQTTLTCARCARLERDSKALMTDIEAAARLIGEGNIKEAQMVLKSCELPTEFEPEKTEMETIVEGVICNRNE